MTRQEKGGLEGGHEVHRRTTGLWKKRNGCEGWRKHTTIICTHKDTYRGEGVYTNLQNYINVQLELWATGNRERCCVKTEGAHTTALFHCQLDWCHACFFNTYNIFDCKSCLDCKGSTSSNKSAHLSRCGNLKKKKKMYCEIQLEAVTTSKHATASSVIEMWETGKQIESQVQEFRCIICCWRLVDSTGERETKSLLGFKTRVKQRV